MRNKQIRKSEAIARQHLAPLAGVTSANMPPMTEAEYIDLVDFTGRQCHPGKRFNQSLRSAGGSFRLSPDSGKKPAKGA